MSHHRHRWALAAAAVLLAIWVTAPAAGQISPKPPAGPEGEPKGSMREQLWWVPVAMPNTGEKLMLETTVYRPPGNGPFPLLVLNHGSPGDATKRRADPRTRWTEQSKWFLSQGFVVVIPMRRGYARSEGDWGENYGKCSSPDYLSAGLNGAWDIKAVTEYFRAQTFIQPDRVLLVGQSAGGWGVTAASTQPLEGVIGIINFAGGRGGPAKPGAPACAPEQLVYVLGQWGKQARLPTLWIYTENDALFGPSLTRRMAEAFKAGGAPMEYVLLPPFANNGHNLFHSASGLPIWSPIVGSFLQKIGYGPKS